MNKLPLFMPTLFLFFVTWCPLSKADSFYLDLKIPALLYNGISNKMHGFGFDIGYDWSHQFQFNLFVENNGGSFNEDSQNSGTILQSVENQFCIPEIRYLFNFNNAFYSSIGYGTIKSKLGFDGLSPTSRTIDTKVAKMGFGYTQHWSSSLFLRGEMLAIIFTDPKDGRHDLPEVVNNPPVTGTFYKMLREKNYIPGIDFAIGWNF